MLRRMFLGSLHEKQFNGSYFLADLEPYGFDSVYAALAF